MMPVCRGCSEDETGTADPGLLECVYGSKKVQYNVTDL